MQTPNWRFIRVGPCGISPKVYPDGWTEPAIQFAKDVAGKLKGKRWQAEGILLRTLEQVDNELDDWTPNQDS